MRRESQTGSGPRRWKMSENIRPARRDFPHFHLCPAAAKKISHVSGDLRLTRPVRAGVAMRIDARDRHKVLKQLNDSARMTHKKDPVERKPCPFAANYELALHLLLYLYSSSKAKIQ